MRVEFSNNNEGSITSFRIVQLYDAMNIQFMNKNQKHLINEHH